MTKPNLKFVKKFDSSPCHACLGTGYKVGFGVHRKDALRNPCKVCNGTGKWIEDNYHLILTTPKGQSIAFQVDGLK